MTRLILIATFIFGMSALGDEKSPRLLVHLLDYLAKDYGGAVENGKVISAPEYEEQVEFIDIAVAARKELPELSGNDQIGKKLANLKSLISEKKAANDVAALAREIQQDIIAATGMELAPRRWPDLVKARQQFAESCAVCHGERGAGDGPAGRGLEPAPANFLDDEKMREAAPFGEFNVIRLGVPGTGMTAFSQYSDDEAWGLAFYVVALRYLDAGEQLRPPVGNEADLKRAATAHDNDLLSQFSGSDEEKHQALIALRLSSVDSDSQGGGGTLKKAHDLLASSLEDYKAGQKEAAQSKALQSYLEGVEPMEAQLKATNRELVETLEARMMAVRGAMAQGKSVDEVESLVGAAIETLNEAQKTTSDNKMSPWLAFFAAFAIIFREGFEAVLIIISLLSIISAAKAKKAAAWVHGGWIAALACGVAAWFFSGFLLQMSGASREFMEGFSALLAVVVLLSVGFWLHSHTEATRWKTFLKDRVDKALAKGSLFGLAALAFVAVFREAIETVLFLRAVWLDGADGVKAAMYTGVGISFAAILIIGWGMLRYAARIPIRKLFSISSLIMAILAFVLTGKGLHSLQESGFVSETMVSAAWSFEELGLYPTRETLLAQLFTVGLIIVLWRQGRRPASVTASS